MFCSAFQSETCYCGNAETQQKFLKCVGETRSRNRKRERRRKTGDKHNNVSELKVYNMWALWWNRKLTQRGKIGLSKNLNFYEAQFRINHKQTTCQNLKRCKTDLLLGSTESIKPEILELFVAMDPFQSKRISSDPLVITSWLIKNSRANLYRYINVLSHYSISFLNFPLIQI